MATGYIRQDTSNEIADGEFISADPLDAEFDGIVAAFNATTGHAHDGTSGNGGPITKLGPVQDLVVGTTTVLPKTTNTLDLGSTTFKFKDAHFDGVVNSDSFVGPLTGAVTGNASTATALETARTIAISGQVTGDATSFDGTANISINVSELSASSLNTGTVPNGRMTGSYTGITGTGALTTGSIASGFGNINIGSNTFTGNGSGITAINGTNITTGTINNSRLPSAISVTSVTASGSVTGKLSHAEDGGYLTVGSHNISSYGSGSGRIHYKPSVSTFTFDKSGGGVTIAADSIVGGLTHDLDQGYMLIGSYDTTVYGTGSARVWWSNNDKQLTILSEAGNDATVVASAFSGALNANNITSGTVSSNRITGSYSNLTGTGVLNSGSITSGFGSINIGSSVFTGNGSGISSLNASEISSGTLSVSRLGTSTANSDWVLDRTSEAAASGIGTYNFLLGPDDGHTAGTNYAGSSLRTPALGLENDGDTLSTAFSSGPSGTWKAMDTNNTPANFKAFGIFLRIA